MNEETPFERGGERGVNDTEVLVFDVQTMEEARLDAAEAWGVDPNLPSRSSALPNAILASRSSGVISRYCS